MTVVAERPDGPVVVNFSGGRTSALMLRLLLDDHGGALPDDWHVVFTNTGREMPQTLDFVHECGERWGVPIAWIEYQNAAPKYREVNHNSASRNGEPFMEVIDNEKSGYLPSVFVRFCTRELKVRLLARYLRQARGLTTWTSALGIRADEPRRVKSESGEKYALWYPLVAKGVTRQDVDAFWRAQDFDLHLPNVGGKCWLGNCDGCFLKSEASLGALARYYPERAKWWEDLEARTGRTFDKRINRKDLREFVEDKVKNQGELALFAGLDGEGLLCQADHGDCTG